MCAHAQPVSRPRAVEVNILEPFGLEALSGREELGGVGGRERRLWDRVVCAQDFHGFLVAAGFALRKHNVVDGLAFVAEAGEPDAEDHPVDWSMDED